LQEWGHKVSFLIGGFTTKIGDPTGRDTTRKEITDAEIKKNAKKYIEQVGRVLLTNPAIFEIRNNDDWFGKMKTAEFLTIIAQVTQAQLIERDMFQKRIREGKEIRMHEMLYPIVQGYDSVMLKDQICMCGNDQLFNEMMGRFFQERYGQMPQTIITGTILVGTDGIQKMSKSLNNYIGVADTPNDKYGKIMSVADSAVFDYFRLATTVDSKTLAKIKKEMGTANPRDLKMRLAHTIVALYDGETAADKAQTNFVKIFQEHQLPSKIPTHTISKPTLLLDLLVEAGLASSKSEARRLIQQGGVSIDERVTNDITLILKPKTPTILQVGKRRFLKIT